MSGTSVSPRRAKVLFRTVAMIPHGHAAQAQPHAHAALHHGSLATGGNFATIGVCGLTGGLHEYRAGLPSPHIRGGTLDADADARMKVSDVMRARTCHDRHPTCHQDLVIRTQNLHRRETTSIPIQPKSDRACS